MAPATGAVDYVPGSARAYAAGSPGTSLSTFSTLAYWAIYGSQFSVLPERG